jgi:hypothetical protein
MNRSTKRQALKKWGKSRQSRKDSSREEDRRIKSKESPRQKQWDVDRFSSGE